MYKNFKVAVFFFFIISGVIFFIFLAIQDYVFKKESDANLNKTKFIGPATVQAVFLTNYSAASSKKIDEIIELSKKSEINAVIIDIKDWSGYIDYDAKIPQADLYQSKRILILNLKALIEKLHQHNIYSIARIVVFQDPVLAKARLDLAVRRGSKNGPLWLDNMGLAWLDPTSQEVWDYNIALAKDAVAHGFDEINFDYVRFASDGYLASMVFPNWDKNIPRAQVIKRFFEYVRAKMNDAVISVDLFGYTTVNKDDLGIGQIIEDAFPNFDYLCPMTYPSLYNSGFLGLDKPELSPYIVVKHSMNAALVRLDNFNKNNVNPSTVKFRPWVQYFKGYGKEMINEQIRAIKEALGDRYSGYIIWNPVNNYSVLVSDKN